MNKLFAVLPLVAALAACNGGDPSSPAPTAAPAATAPAPAPTAAPAPAASETTSTPAPAAKAAKAATELPPECQQYVAKVTACVAKQSGAVAEAMKTGLEQARFAWASVPSDQLGATCKAAADSFAQQASAMQC